MAVRLTQTEQDQTYFCTFTCINWLHLFELTNLYDEIYKWFGLLSSMGHQIAGFAIMPNHLHVLIHLMPGEKTINQVLANGKRFLAYEIVKRLKATQRDDILNVLKAGVKPEDRVQNRKHRVFEISSDIKPCYTEKFLIQKLEYIHANPLRGKWCLCETADGYFHSSAAFYELNEVHPNVTITHYKDLGRRL